MNIKRWNVDFFGGKYFPSILIIFEFDLIIARARVKERNSIHSRMIGRETRKRVQEGCRRTFKKFDSFISPERGKEEKSEERIVFETPSPSREPEISLAQEGMGLKEQKLGQILATGIESRENLIQLRLGSLLSPISDIPLPSVLVANSRSSATLLYFIYIYFIRRNG